MACAAPSVPVLEDSCGYEFLACNDDLVSTNTGRPDLVGGPSGDTVFVITAWEPSSFVVSTCRSETRLETSLALYDAPPRRGPTVREALPHPPLTHPRRAAQCMRCALCTVSETTDGAPADSLGC